MESAIEKTIPLPNKPVSPGLRSGFMGKYQNYIFAAVVLIGIVLAVVYLNKEQKPRPMITTGPMVPMEPVDYEQKAALEAQRENERAKMLKQREDEEAARRIRELEREREQTQEPFNNPPRSHQHRPYSTAPTMDEVMKNINNNY